MALATPDDVAVALGRPLSSDEEDRVDGLLAIASAHVLRGGWKFEPGTYTLGRIVRDGKVKLPAVVASVEEVRWIDPCTGAETELTGWTSRGRTVYGLSAYSMVEVDFTVAAEVPDEIVQLVAGAAAGTFAAPPVGASSETVGPYTVSYVNQSNGRVYLTASDKAILSGYRDRPAINLLP